jgi:hypothetical protein
MCVAKLISNYTTNKINTLKVKNIQMCVCVCVCVCVWKRTYSVVCSCECGDDEPSDSIQCGKFL